MLKRNLIANYLGQGWNAIMAFAFIPVYVKYLGVESYGLIGLFTLIYTYLGVFDFGIQPSLAREMARFTAGGTSTQFIRDLLRTAEIIVVAMCLLIILFVFLFSKAIAHSWVKPESLPVDIVNRSVILIGIVATLRFVEGIYRSSLLGLQRQVFFNLVNSGMSTIRAFGSILVLIYVSPTIIAFFIWQGIVSVLTILILVLGTYARIPKMSTTAKFSIEVVNSIWRFAFGMMGITTVSLLISQLDKVYLSKLISLRDFGYYTIAASVAAVILMLVTPVSLTWYPKMNQLHVANDKTGLANSFHQSSQLITVFAGSATLLIIGYTDLILDIWANNPSVTANVSPLLKLLLIANLISCFNIIPNQVQLVHGWTSIGLKINSFSLVALIPLLWFGVSAFSAVGAAVALVIINFLQFAIGQQFTFSKILKSEKIKWYFSDILQPLVIGILCILIFKTVFHQSTSQYLNILLLVVVGLCTLLSMSLCSSFLRHKLFVLIFRRQAHSNLL